MTGDLRMFWRFATGLRGFLSSPFDCQKARQRHELSLGLREESFLSMLRSCIYAVAASPYRALLAWAGVEYGDLERLVRMDGIEGALRKLYEAGVRVDVEEFKARRPLVRPGLELPLTEASFDNPVIKGSLPAATGGTTGPRRRLAVDFDSLEHDALCRFLTFEAHGVAYRPFGLWQAVPPGSSGLKNALCAVKWGNPVERWFSPTPVCWRGELAKSALFTWYAILRARSWGFKIPVPEHVPAGRTELVARWLAEKVRSGQPALICMPASRAVRVASNALERGWDISGTVFRVGGEPFTEAKQEWVRKAGARAICAWSMAECGLIGGGCARAEEPDEVHVFLGKVAVIRGSKRLPDGTVRDGVLHLTTLLPCAPKIMLNLDTGDCGALSSRRCGCLLEELGLSLRLHTIRSYEKLTAGGMHFLGSEFVQLVETVLPQRFGGGPTDYQFVETEKEGQPEVKIVVSPRVGPIDEAALLRTVLCWLGSRSRGHWSMVWQWEQSGVLRVAREEPFVTETGKVPHLRLLRA